MTGSERMAAGEALAAVAAVLDRLDPDRSALAPASRLECARLARRLSERMTALADLLLAEADQAQASLRTSGTPTTSWLGIDQKLSRRESAGALHRATALAGHPGVGAAAAAGRVGAGQARAIIRVLDDLAPQLDQPQQQAAEQVMLRFAVHMDSDQLSKAAAMVVKEVAPEVAEEALELRLQREAEAAHRGRSLRFFRNGAAVRFDGSLPQVEAEAWMALLDAHAESLRRNALEARDPLAPPVTPEQRRADALVAMIGCHQVAGQAPSSGGDRPRVLVTVAYEQLRQAAAGAGLIAGDARLSAGELRRLCCDAGIIPAVLGGRSEVLDIGRETRQVPRAIRTALTLRDGGCAFPTCHTRPSVCEAHHIRPWWDGGATALGNLVLLCHHHHGLVEPARYGVRDQWEVRIALDGQPEFLPPVRFDPARRPLRHGRSGNAGTTEAGGGAGSPTAA